MKNTNPNGPSQAAEFKCPGCSEWRSVDLIGGAVTNELLAHEAGEGAPICAQCVAAAGESRKRRRQIEQSVRRMHRDGTLLTLFAVGPGPFYSERP